MNIFPLRACNVLGKSLSFTVDSLFRCAVWVAPASGSIPFHRFPGAGDQAGLADVQKNTFSGDR
jgi:hypothetical protein